MFSPEGLFGFHIFSVHSNEHDVFDQICVKHDRVEDDGGEELDPDQLWVSFEHREDHPALRV